MIYESYKMIWGDTVKKQVKAITTVFELTGECTSVSANERLKLKLLYQSRAIAAA